MVGISGKLAISLERSRTPVCKPKLHTTHPSLNHSNSTYSKLLKVKVLHTKAVAKKKNVCRRWKEIWTKRTFYVWRYKLCTPSGFKHKSITQTQIYMHTHTNVYKYRNKWNFIKNIPIYRLVGRLASTCQLKKHTQRSIKPNILCFWSWRIPSLRPPPLWQMEKIILFWNIM